MKRFLIRSTLLLLLGFTVVILFLPALIENRENRILHSPPYKASQSAKTLHSTLLIADLHADSLLWGRNLLNHSSRGQVDVPRLIEGNVALQVFSVPTKVPHDVNIQQNDERSDDIFWLALAERWPPATWNSLTQRALYQARRLHKMAGASSGQFAVIESATDLSRYIERRQHEHGITAGLLSIEGAHALDGNLENVDVLYNAGFRMMSPTHFFDNDIGGSSAGVRKTGLTAKGRELIQRMEAKHMIVDLAHASSQTITDVLAIAKRPVVISHTGVWGTCNNNRNLTDAQIRAIAQNGGLIGIGYWQVATCGTDAQAVARAIHNVANLVGAEHVALGSDFDGGAAEPFDTTGVIEITDALLAEGFTQDQVRMIMGGNVLRFLEQELP